VPVEFAAAAFRFGHSMIRPAYDLNAIVRQRPVFSPADVPGELDDLRGFRERPPQWEIAWRRFFRFPESAANELQLSRRIDTRLAASLGRLPGAVATTVRSLPERNLRRGQALGLPSGQAVARAMGLPTDLVLSGEALGLDEKLTSKFGADTPLWFYVLKEAETFCEGQRLGPVGGRIVAEVLLGLLQGDPASYLSVAPNWRPEPGRFGCGADGRFGMPELLRFAGARV
jgi:hypothetical protein